ncbi:hypothetical protein [Spongiactinospora rosea]|nr:hypothetical protein [Spongiactinospora rosea]
MSDGLMYVDLAGDPCGGGAASLPWAAMATAVLASTAAISRLDRHDRLSPISQVSTTTTT